jgi:hypothetical protein
MSTRTTTFDDLLEAFGALRKVRQVIVCEPGLGLKIETEVLRHGLDLVWTVRESEHCPAGKVLLINEPREP